jgi:hypothetical protein
MLTRLTTDVLTAWDGPPPRLAYITDACHHPTEYFHTVLRRMDDPHHSGRRSPFCSKLSLESAVGSGRSAHSDDCRPGHRLDWTRVVDFYHVSEYVSKLGDVLFGADEPSRRTWLRRMLHTLKHDENGVSTVLRSAAWRRSQLGLTTTQLEFM